MVISPNSQLGLMFHDIGMMKQYVEDTKKSLARKDTGVKDDSDSAELINEPNNDDSLFKEIMHRMSYNPERIGSEFYTLKHPHPYMYLIQKSVWECAEKIKIKENFSCSIFNKIRDGEHMYLLGKDEFYHFVKFNGVIRGAFWNRQRGVAFEIGFHLEKDRYYFPSIDREEFNRLIRLMTYIELGEVEIVEILKGRNNGKSKKDGKITNTSNYNVYVVDSSWNKLIIRTEGYPVTWHFRLQACGKNFADRKLIFIDAFEKQGYTRRPKAEIVK